MKYALILTTALVFTACSPSADSTPTSETVKSASEAKPTVKIIRAKTEHVAKSDPYTLTWETIPADRPVRIEVSSDPEAKLGAGELVTEDAQGSFTWITEEPLKRHYFTLIPESGDPVKTAVRLLPLEGGRNFRDIGGYKTKDGKSVKWGQVFRSGTMVGLTDTDYDYLSSAGIAVICDFRSESERKNEPTNWQAPNGEYVTFPDAVGEMGMMSGFMEILKGPDPSPEKISKVMADSYPDMAKQYAPHYTEVFDRLAGGDIPLAFNCSAGKDRAGTSAALILTALGVPKETVVEDYALSEAYVCLLYTSDAADE